MINEKYYEYIPFKQYIYASYTIGLIIWSFVIYLFWWKNKQSKNKFSIPILFCLSLPYLLTIFQIKQYIINPAYPELSSCLKFFKNKEYIAIQNFACSTGNIKVSLGDTMYQSADAFHITYILLLLMIISTAFKYNIFDNNMIRNFSIWISLYGLWTTSSMYLGLFGMRIYGTIIALNQVLGASSIASILIILINLTDKYRKY